MPCDIINHCFVPHLRCSFVLTGFLIHALTGVAIACRPFGPAMLGIGKNILYRLLLSLPTILVQSFLKFVGQWPGGRTTLQLERSRS
jgi:hypothetical protein